MFFFFSSRRRHTRLQGDWSSDVCSSDLVRGFTLDFEHAKVSEAQGKLGARGKRVEIKGRSSGVNSTEIEKMLAVEVYDDFPTLAVASVAYKNSGPTEVRVDQVVARGQRLNASLADPGVPSYKL